MTHNITIAPNGAIFFRATQDPAEMLRSTDISSRDVLLFALFWLWPWTSLGTALTFSRDIGAGSAAGRNL